VNAISPGMRRSAILLHSLNDKDRNWLLKNMPINQREMLTELLEELREIGIPRDEKLIQDFFQECAPKTELIESITYVEITAEEAALKTISGADAFVMFKVLGKQPSIFIAKFLSIQPWDWKADFIELLDEQKMRTVFKMLALPAHAHLTERAKNELVQIVCASLLIIGGDYPRKNTRYDLHMKNGIFSGVKRLLPRPLTQWFGAVQRLPLPHSTEFQRLPGA
jgi:flagellar motor switch protein FliG